MLVLATGDAFSLTYGLVIWSLLTLLVGEWYAILWVVYAFDYWERVRIPQVRHLVIRLAVQQADRPEGGGLTPRMVWEDLVALVAAQASVPVQEVHPEQRFGDLPDYC
jgi:hypothetical protein